MYNDKTVQLHKMKRPKAEYKPQTGSLKYVCSPMFA